MRQHRFQKGQRPETVVTEILLGDTHRLPGLDERGEVQHAVEVVALEDVIQLGAVVYIAAYQFSVCGKGLHVAVAQIVVDHHLVPALQEFSNHHAADIARASRDQ